MKTKLSIAILFIFTMFLSGCGVYDTLYDVPSPVGEVVQIPDEDIIIEEITEEDLLSELIEEADEEEIEVFEVEVLKEIGETEEEIVDLEEIPELEEEISGDATIIIVEETDLINLQLQAEDPDRDILEFIFTNPLDENGKWQTTYGDAGEYTVTVTVSDGELTNTRDVLIIVNRKEEAPAIISFMPENTVVTIDETEVIGFSIRASDLNQDELIYTWKLDGDEVSDEDFFNYEATYDDSGSHTIKVTVSDAVLSTESLWSVTVNNVNREPILEDILDISIEETGIVIIEPEAFDPDGDEIEFTISDPVGDDGVWETTYEDSGIYAVTVTAYDGIDEVSQEIIIEVENVNRAPVILDIIQG